MKKITQYLIISFLIISQVAYSQDLDFVFDYYGVEDGLSQSEVNCIFQDSRGLIWIGTQAGLNRFDGRNFVSFDKNPLDQSTISSGWIYSINEDSKGNLWIGTNNGLNKFNPKTEKFEHYTSSELKDKIIYSILIDEKDFVWIKTNYSITKINPETKKFNVTQPRDIDEQIKPKEEFSFPMIKTNKGIWSGSSFGLQFFSFQYDLIQSFHHDPNNQRTIPSEYVTALAQDNSGNLFVGTENGIAHFETYRGITRPLLSSKINKVLEEAGSKFITGLIYIEQKGKRILIISTYGAGIITYNLTTEISNTFQSNVSNPQSLKYNRVKSLFRDNSDNFWIGLNASGLNKFSPKSIKFKTYKNSGKNSKSGIYITDNIIASIYANKHEIWVGTWSGGLNIINKRTHRTRVLNTLGAKGERIVDNHVHALYKRENENIWIGTKNGISIYSKKTNNFFSFEEFFGIPIIEELLNTRINVIKETSDHNMLIGSNKGLVFFNLSSKTFSFPIPSKKINKISSAVYEIAISDNIYWIATFAGLYKINKAQEIIKLYEKADTLTEIGEGVYNTVNSSGVFDVIEDNSGFLWLATESGVNKMNPVDETFVYYTKEKNQIPNNTIYEFLLDKNDNLWLSSNYGIAALNTKTDSVKSYTNADGLQGLEFNNGASFANLETGEFYFGGPYGFNLFFPDSIKENTTKPTTTLLDYTIINNEKENKHSLLGEEEIKMSYSDNSIKITFASLEFTNPSKNNFMYILEGRDEEWTMLEEQNHISFNSLAPNNYILRVKGSNNDLVWGYETSIKITVTPPIYNNIWAYLVYLLIVSLGIYKIWNDNKKKQKISNEEIRNKQLMNLKLEQQKEELDIQNTSMTDSINYAKHIQEAMLPSEYLFKKLLPNSFILFKTKDIVSGDFYWIAQRGTKIFIAAVDCTGHGVPGAFMSIIGFDLLKNIVKERGVEDPAEILNQLNYGVSDTFRKNNTDEHKVRDGMDMSICVIDRSKHTLEFSGAMNPLCFIREDSISIVKGNRFSIGSFNDNEDNKFDNHLIKYKAGDTIYLFSDGYADQFGGPMGKKFKQKRFLHMLLNIHHLPADKQKNELTENFENWKGQIEQVDDVLVIGFKL